LPALQALPASLRMVPSRKIDTIKKFEPKYPEPVQAKTSVRVNFVALKSDVNTLAKHFFDDETVKPGEVGEAAFNEALKNAKGRKK
jgi:hypothetical protein